MLNFTDITYGQLGNNKYYSLQLISDRGGFSVFRKWGRVGAAKPASTLESHGSSLDRAKASFQKQFLSKSGNHWPLQGAFQKKKGKYVLVELADDEPEDDEGEEDKENNDSKQSAAPPCSLPNEIQDLLTLICDNTLIAQEVSALNFDLKRMPLGRLSTAQISQGYTILQQLSDALTAIHEVENPPAPAPAPTPAAPAPPATAGRVTRRRAAAATTTPTAAAAASTPSAGKRKKKPSKADATRLAQLKASLKTLTSEFYTLIPHDFGRSLPPTIDNMETVKNKIDLLQVLADIEISQQLQKEGKKKNADAAPMSPLDSQYKMINTDMTPLDEKSEEFQRLARFLETTQESSQSSFGLKIKSILKIARPAEQGKRDMFENVDNHRLLWHGSRLSNVVGILSQGLRIAPPEAPVNGYNFGKGIYFADAVTKSAQYCWTTPQRPRAVLLVAEVALGKSYEAPRPEYLDFKAVQARGCTSTKGVGRLAPKEETFEQIEDGVVVPIGKIAPQDGKGSVMFNEFIVYKQEQVRLRYLITTDFDYSARWNSGFGSSSSTTVGSDSSAGTGAGFGSSAATTGFGGFGTGAGSVFTSGFTSAFGSGSAFGFGSAASSGFGSASTSAFPTAFPTGATTGFSLGTGWHQCGCAKLDLGAGFKICVCSNKGANQGASSAFSSALTSTAAPRGSGLGSNAGSYTSTVFNVPFGAPTSLIPSGSAGQSS